MDFERMLRYCAALELNNERGWFHANHKQYEQARQDFIDLTDYLKFALADHVSADLSERLLLTRAKDMLYRIPRDMRVYRHQPPYNPSWRAYLGGDRHAVTPVGYYYMIAPGDRSHFGTGGWCPDAAWLRQIRRYISDHFTRFDEALAACGLPLEGEKLKRVPRDFDPGDPAGEYLRYKEWYVSVHFRDEELGDFDGFVQKVLDGVRRMEPLRRFFSDAFLQKPRQPWEEL